jgi:hypothetical protein
MMHERDEREEAGTPEAHGLRSGILEVPRDPERYRRRLPFGEVVHPLGRDALESTSSENFIRILTPEASNAIKVNTFYHGVSMRTLTGS